VLLLLELGVLLDQLILFQLNENADREQTPVQLGQDALASLGSFNNRRVSREMHHGHLGKIIRKWTMSQIDQSQKPKFSEEFQLHLMKIRRSDLLRDPDKQVLVETLSTYTLPKYILHYPK